ncbi:MAG: winged helix-turn-helix domain-containing protein [Nitrososphaera sp.]|nr:winged helix-turn-helix domain-containing protein [Nitrososphaera sp.]
MSNVDNPFLKFLAAAPQKLFGRDQQLRTILRGVTGRTPASFQIACFRGIGKSALLTHLSDETRVISTYAQGKTSYLQPPFNDPGRLYFFYLDCALFPEGFSFPTWILKQIQASGKLQACLEKANTESLSKKTISILEQTFELAKEDSIRVVLLLDHFDRPFQNLPADEGVALRPLVNLASFVIASERPLFELNAPVYASWLADVTSEVYLDPLSDNEAETLLEYVLTQECRQPLAEDKLQAYREILPLTGYHPPFILRGASELFELRQKLKSVSEQDLEAILEERLYTAFRGNFLHFWRHIKESQKQALYRSIQTNFDMDRLTDVDKKSLERLRTLGLVTWAENRKTGQGQFKPFSTAWSDFIQREYGDDEEKEPPEAQKESEPKASYYLTPIQHKLLSYFYEHRGQTCSYEHILQTVWERPEDKRGLHLLRETVRQLREAIGDIGEIANKRGKGYQFQPSDIDINLTAGQIETSFSVQEETTYRGRWRNPLEETWYSLIDQEVRITGTPLQISVEAGGNVSEHLELSLAITAEPTLPFKFQAHMRWGDYDESKVVTANSHTKFPPIPLKAVWNEQEQRFIKDLQFRLTPLLI